MFDQIRKLAGLGAITAAAVYAAARTAGAHWVTGSVELVAVSIVAMLAVFSSGAWMVKTVVRQELRDPDYLDHLAHQLAALLGGEFESASGRATTAIVHGVEDAVTNEIFVGKVGRAIDKAHRDGMVRQAQQAVGMAPVVSIHREQQDN